MVWTDLLFFFVFAIGLFFAYQFLRYSKKGDLFFFIVLPFVLIPYWMHRGIDDVFKWVKIYSVVLGALLVIFIRFFSFQRRKLLEKLLILVLAINILEAVIKSVLRFEFLFVLNAFVGLIVIIDLFGKSKGKVSTKSPFDLVYPKIGWSWVLGYTFWNLGFVFLVYPHSVLKHIVVLGVPIVAEFFTRGTWVQTRAYTLGIYLLAIFTFGDFLSYSILSSFNTGLMSYAVSAVGFCFALYSISYDGLFFIKN